MDSTFDSSNPNIYHANATLGGGVLGGSIAGLEYDENGDIKGFSPQNFALGFASGVLGSKSLQFLAKKAQTNPKAKALLERIKTKHAKNQSNLATMSNQNPKIDKITPQKPQGQNTMQIKQNQNGDYLLKDSEGKSRIVRKDLAQEWIKEFGLSDLSQSYKPSLSEPIKTAINKDIEINTKDLLKLINKGRTKYIKNIKSTFENPKKVFIDDKDDLIFAKKLSDRLFFVSVSRDYGDNYLNITLSPKKDTILQNKLKKAKKVIFDKGS